MRLWVLCLLALLLVGLLVAVEQSGVFDTVTGRNNRTNIPIFQDYERGSIPFVEADGKSVFVAQVDPRSPQILSGFPSYASTKFRLPIDSRPESGTYDLSFSADAVNGAEGALRVTINGIKRADTVLQPGTARQRVRVELTPTELAAGELDVRLALVGQGPLAECTPNQAVAAVLTVLPETGLRLRLDKAPDSVRDRLALWGDLIPVKWNGATAPDTATLLNAARLAERGYGLYFGDGGFSAASLADITKGAPVRPDGLQQLSYPIPLVSQVENAGARRFDRETSWRFRYNASQLPGGELPSAVDLRMMLGPVAGTRTSLFVTLNDHLLLTRALGDTDERFANSLALPAADHLDRNELEITLTSRLADETRCGAMRLIAAELLPDSVLRGGGERLVTEAARLRAALGPQATVDFKTGELSAPQAHSVALLLAGLRPNALKFGGAQPAATVQAITGDLEAAIRRVSPTGQQWLMYFPTDEREGASVVPFSPRAALGDTDVALLVTINRPAVVQPAPAPSPTASATVRPRATADAAR
jgi:hypothetical protein